MLWAPPKLEVRPELPANCGAACTATNPALETWWLRWERLLIEPRAIPIPADPDLTTNCDGGKLETGPPLPTTTVFTVPSAGATSGWMGTILPAV